MVTVQRSTMTKQVYEIIKSKIINGEYSEGQKLTEQGIAKELAVSATPVREAFKNLTSEGFIETIPYKGVCVKVYTKKDVREAYLVRSKLEGLVVQLLMEKLTDNKIENLKVVTQKAVEASEENIIDKYHPIYEAIYLMAESQVLINNILTVNSIINVERLAKLDTQINREKYHEVSLKLVDFIINRETKKAIKCAEENVLFLMEIVLNNIK